MGNSWSFFWISFYLMWSFSGQNSTKEVNCSPVCLLRSHEFISPFILNYMTELQNKEGKDIESDELLICWPQRSLIPWKLSPWVQESHNLAGSFFTACHKNASKLVCLSLSSLQMRKPEALEGKVIYVKQSAEPLESQEEIRSCRQLGISRFLNQRVTLSEEVNLKWKTIINSKLELCSILFILG